MLSKKHFEMVAEVLAIVREENEFELEDNVIDSIAYRLAFEFKADNPRFDTERFIAATKETNNA